MDECSQCGRTDRRAGTIWGCAACQIATGVRAARCEGCGQERVTVDDTGYCRFCRHDSEQRGWMLKTFGFDSPAGLQRVPVPVGLPCAGCDLPIQAGVQGVWMTSYEHCQKPWHKACAGRLFGIG